MDTCSYEVKPGYERSAWQKNSMKTRVDDYFPWIIYIYIYIYIYICIYILAGVGIK